MNAAPDDNQRVAPARRATGGLSLRARLVLGMLVMVVVAFAAFGVGSAVILRRQQLERADEQLSDITRRNVLGGGGRPGPGPRGQGGPDASNQLTPGTGQPGSISVQLLDADGGLVRAVPSGFPQDPDPLPDVQGLTFDDAVGAAGPWTVGAVGDPSVRYRVRADPLPRSRQTVVYGVPLARDDATLTRLLLLEAAGGAAVVLVLAFLGLRAVTVGLRPLDDMTATATAIAAGDLSRRVGPAAARHDEVGRLGRALDAMLTQIEGAFDHRAASEGRLRRFVADASHELRTPLTTIRGYAELHRRGMLPDDQVDDAMRRIEAEATRMGVLVEDLLLLARLDERRGLERVAVDLVVVAEEAVRDLRAAAPDRSVTVHATGPVVVDGDPARLHQVVANLLDNARRHTPAGSPVTVDVETDGGEAVVRVRDEGPGIPADVAERIFERSFRGDRTSSPTGSGLGLSIVAAIVAAHDGTVRVDGAPGAGATFVVRLPLRSADGAGADPAPGAAATSG